MVRHALLGSKKQMDSEQFIEALYSVDPSLRAAYLPRAGDTTTTTTLGRVWTHDGTIAARVTAQGNGVLVTFNGTSNEADTPDTTSLSCIEPTGMTQVALVNVTDTAAAKVVASKDNVDGANREWTYRYTNAESMQVTLLLPDGSGSVFRTSNNPLTAGVTALDGFTYSGVGGASAADGITLYRNAAVVPSAAGTFGAAYTAMSNTSALVRIGARGNSLIEFFSGSMGFWALWGAALTATQMEAVKLAVEEYYGVNL